MKQANKLEPIVKQSSGEYVFYTDRKMNRVKVELIDVGVFRRTGVDLPYNKIEESAFDEAEYFFIREIIKDKEGALNYIVDYFKMADIEN